MTNQNEPNLEEEDDELYEHYRIVADKGQSLMRLDLFIRQHVQNASRNKVQVGIEAGAIKVNDQLTKASYKIKPGDVVTMSMAKPPRDNEILPENSPLQTWQPASLQFSDNRLEEVARRLEEKFNVSIKLESHTMGNCLMTAAFEDLQLSEILETISIMLELTYEVEGETILLRGNGCWNLKKRCSGKINYSNRKIIY